MSTGGSGFYTLLWTPQDGSTPIRLAYLQIDPLRRDLSRPRDHAQVGFFEVWNEPAWDQLSKGQEGTFAALQHAVDRGEIELTKTVRTPMDELKRVDYDLKDVQLLDLDPTQTVFSARLPRYLRFESPYEVIESGHCRLPIKPEVVVVPAGDPAVPLAGKPQSKVLNEPDLIAKLNALVARWEDAASENGTLQRCVDEVRKILRGNP